jgi:iron complex outermembrane receptor protein
MRKIILSLIFFCQFSAFSQSRIRVLNEEDRSPVVYANVYFPDTKTGTLTDADGFFTTGNQSGKLLTQISILGYKTFLENIDIQKDTVLFLTPSHFDLQEVTVSGAGSRLQGENVINVEKLNLIENPETQGISLAQKLASVPGLSNFSTGSGIGKPVIRGLSGNRIAVFAQGVRLENQQWGDEHGLGLDENGYEQVEIIKGPASLLYGSDALGGVLYFNDERFARENSEEAALQSEFDGNTAGWRNSAALKMSRNRFHANVFGAFTTHKDYSDGNGKTVINSRFNTANIKTALGYTGKNFNTTMK